MINIRSFNKLYKFPILLPFTCLLFLLQLSFSEAQATVYKWTDSNGQVHYTNSPPAEESLDELQDNGKKKKLVKKAQEQTATEETQQKKIIPIILPPKVKLVGTWCEYANSKTLDGEKSNNSEKQWSFTNKDGMTYQDETSQTTISAKYSINGSQLIVSNSTDNKLMGTYDILEKEGLLLTLKSSSGYLFWRRGDCK